MTRQALLLGMVLATLLAPSAAAREFHPAKVDDIIAALESAQAGDIVTVTPGTYTMPPIRCARAVPRAIRSRCARGNLIAD